MTSLAVELRPVHRHVETDFKQDVKAPVKQNLEIHFKQNAEIFSEATYTISKELQEEITQNLGCSTEAARKKIEEWMIKASETGAVIDIGRIVEVLKWTSNDIAYVETQSNQQQIVNFQRENVILQRQCSSIIREVTKTQICNKVKKAFQTILKKNDARKFYQISELLRLGNYYIDHYTNSEKSFQVSIKAEEIRSKKICDGFKNESKFLLENPSAYEATLIKENTKKNIEDHYLRLHCSKRYAGDIGKRLEAIKNKAINEINEVPITTPETMRKECQEIVDIANEQTDIIERCITLKERVTMGPCKTGMG
jgi:hypothetical protein